MGSCLSLEGPAGKGGGRRGERGGGGGGDAAGVPGRIAGNGAGNAASLFTRQGKKGTNQDAMVVWENFNGRSDTIFCGVFDGHGPHGHFVARKVRDSLPLRLCGSLISDNHWESPTSNFEGSVLEDSSSPCAYVEAKSPTTGHKEEHPEVFNTMKESFLKAFKVVDKELKLHRNIDSVCSGTTAVTLIKQGQDLIVGNLGDSRAVLGSRDKHGCLVAHQLTVDLKPDLPREARRIKQCNGRVFAHEDEPDVARLWLPNYNSPGLAMARAFGDFCLKDFGLISVPDVTYRLITQKDEFIVLATDGVWDVLSNQEVVDAVTSSPGRPAAARTIVDLATWTWRMKYPTSKTDDCAVVCLFLNVDARADGSSGLSVNRKGIGQGLKMPARQTSKKVLPEDADDRSDSSLSGDESYLEGFSRLDTLVTLPKFPATENHDRATKD